MIDFDPFSEAYFDDPFPIYQRLRDEAPALYLENYDCFFLSRFEHFWNAVRDPRFSHRLGTTSQDLLVGVRPHRALSSLVPPNVFAGAVHQLWRHPGQRAERIRSEFFRGFAALPVRLPPRP